MRARNTENGDHLFSASDRSLHRHIDLASQPLLQERPPQPLDRFAGIIHRLSSSSANYVQTAPASGGVRIISMTGVNEGEDSDHVLSHTS